ncbi:hypothetical protein NLJ89_g9602 [Agrocybe chaxingu]|uniref:Uncharacterized protein n=1 Tax=Agrocybe chaxingu TaxID=84603 RepID=A0A9W8JVJ7_9AGAR|nr:hypothetical protein NLJ89_g9602 [Agrocybe chaxingu]
MGDPSYFRLVPASCATVPIDWTKVPEASKKFLLDDWGTDWSDPKMEKKRPLPATIEDFAKMVHSSKFFGYMHPKLCTLLLDISEFGLAAQAKIPVNCLQIPGPRFYMKYLSCVWFVMFLPGERDGITGCSPKVPEVSWEEEEDKEEEKDKEDKEDKDEDEEDEEENKKQVARDKAVAEEFDPRLCEEIERWGTLRAQVNKRVADWEGFTLKSSLQDAQMSEAIMGLPRDHPAFRSMMTNAMSSLKSMS